MLSGMRRELTGFTIGMAKQSILTALCRPIPGVPKEYLVYITSDDPNSAPISAALQKEISMHLDSRWEPFIDGAPKLPAVLAGALFGTSLQLAVTSRRIWLGTTPLQMRLPLVFTMISDAALDVKAKVMYLQRMALPSEPLKKGFLAPPGPSPFLNNEAGWFEGSENINIEIGRGFLTFKRVIIKTIDVIYDTRMSEEGDPISAKVDLTFETYEILTKNKLAEVYGRPASEDTRKNVYGWLGDQIIKPAY